MQSIPNGVEVQSKYRLAKHSLYFPSVGAAVWVGVHRFRNLPVIIAT